LQLYADFYSADIIVASPLGLRVIVGAEGEEDRDFDFLASVEILVLDQADIFLMQVECSISSQFACSVTVHASFISS
jgi:U3 small nucleolar RNA-associated protein 25